MTLAYPEKLLAFRCCVVPVHTCYGQPVRETGVMHDLQGPYRWDEWLGVPLPFEDARVYPQPHTLNPKR